MDPITTLIVAGLAIAATAAVKKFTESVVDDSYQKLKTSIAEKIEKKYLEPFESGTISEEDKSKLVAALTLGDAKKDPKVTNEAIELFNSLQQLDIKNKAPQEVKENE